jgi:predicted metal-binding membrane protein
MTGSTEHQELTRLSAAEAGLARGLTRSRLIAITCLVALAGAGWSYVGLEVARHMADGHLGSGFNAFEVFARSGDLGRFAQALFETICQPSFGHGATSGHWGVSDIALVFVMWVAMSLAMMLPTAGPMILTYAEIADTAREKGEPVASPLMLTAGYLSIWIGFALVATMLQVALIKLAMLDPAMGTASPLFSGAAFLGAGAYQFSALKHACVTLCQRPFPFFFANWTSTGSGVFRLGFRQGIYCLGCCWAMMLLMLAVGVMNVVWMAALGLIMAAEKLATTTRFSRAVGVVFGLLGVVLIGTAVLAYWPTRSV